MKTCRECGEYFPFASFAQNYTNANSKKNIDRASAALARKRKTARAARWAHCTHDRKTARHASAAAEFRNYSSTIATSQKHFGNLFAASATADWDTSATTHKAYKKRSFI